MRYLWALGILLTASTVAAGGCPAPPYNPPSSNANPTTTPPYVYNNSPGGGTTLTTSKATTTPPPSKCNADNCLRAIRASNMTSRHGSADCQSFFETSWYTVYGTIRLTASTETVIVTATSGLPTNNPQTVPARNLAPRQDPPPPTTLVSGGVFVTPTAIPKYASACSGSVRYASACSCIGVKPRTTTLFYAYTTTVTPTVTATVLIQPTATYRPFVLQGLGTLASIPSLEYFYDYYDGFDFNITIPYDIQHASVYYYDEVTRYVYAAGYGPFSVYASSPPTSGPDKRVSTVYLGAQFLPGLSPPGSTMVPITCDIIPGDFLTCEANDGMNVWGTGYQNSPFQLGGPDYDFIGNVGQEVNVKITYLA
ncbi:hypothetical protein AA313_de0201437 [Arthrobotrys entomopaga]|nr:hypothetical protein AA313_de0201437 [Arthrobotrys entomopaga]